MNSPKSTFQTEHHVFIKVKVTGDSEQRVVEKEDSTWKDNAVYPRTELEMAEDPEKFNVPLSWTIKDNVVLCSRDVKDYVVSPQSSEETGKYNSQNTNAEHHLKEDGDAQHAKFLNGPSAQSKEITQIIDTKRRSPANENCKRLAEIIHVPGLGYKCNICNKMFRIPSLVAFHQKAHSGERPFSCSVCNKRFARKSDLVRHEWIHKRRSLFHCSVCGKGFNAPSRLQSHQKTHVEFYKTNILNKKPTKLLNSYSCEECGKEFSYYLSLIRHRQVHIKNQYNIECEKEKEMSYDCNTCGLTFTRHSYLLEHQQIHTGYVLHVCERCGKRFVSGGSLARHQKTHTEEQDYVVSPQSSEETGKYNSQNTNAEHHLKEDGDAQHAKFLNGPSAQSKEITQIIHTKRRSSVNENCKRLEDIIHVPGLGYKCNICNKMFRFPSWVAIHQKTHSGERPFSCSVCNK
ncbi:zinc finger protein 728-like [Spea bombifrons]|uniref:zinc finger protein 728-like n=1 Tax=Spea bombifrons TaxID=233779 RepID=UPI00234907D1|nr:zinc finger protein 728-like [Spea bombifrons]